MSSAQLIPNVAPTWVNSSGVPLAGGLIYSYVAGTTTPQATYTNETAGTTNTNPVVLNSAGQAQIWLRTDLSYKIIVKDSSGNQISSTDNINVTANPDSISLSMLNAASIVGVAMGVDVGNGKFDVLYDNVTIGVNDSNELYVPTGGITPDKFSSDSKLEVIFKNVRDFSNPGVMQTIPQYEWSSPTLLSNPVTIPPGAASCCGWSPNGEFLAVTSGSANYLDIYQLSNGVLTKLADPGTVPLGAASVCAWSPSGDFLAVGCMHTPYIIIYQRTGNSFTKLSDPASLPQSHLTHPVSIQSLAWSPNSDFLVLTYFSSGGSVNLIVYERSSTTFTDVTTTSTITSTLDGWIAWSPNSSMMAISNSIPASSINIYTRADNVFSLLTNPTFSTSIGNIYNFAFSPDGNFFAVAGETSPYVAIFSIVSGVFTQLSNPSTLPPGAALWVNWSANSEYLLIGDQSGTSPYMTIYQQTGTIASPVFTAIAAPSTVPAGAVLSADWTTEKNYLAVASATTPYIQVYETASTLPGDSFLWSKGVPFV